MANKPEDGQPAGSEQPATPAPSIPLEREIEIAGKLPAVYSNRMLATNTPMGMRIAFGEMRDSTVEPNFHFAAMLSYDDANGLAELIQRQLNLTQRVQFRMGPDGKLEPIQE